MSMTYREILAEIHRLERDIREPDDSEESHLRQRRQQYAKWQLMHEYVRLRPFHVNPHQPRSRQWQDALNKVRELRDKDVFDWLLVQADIARHKEQGIQDVRPPSRGTCYESLLAFMRQREHKARVVLEWEEGAQAHGCYRVNGTFHARTKEILERCGLLQGDDGAPPIGLDDPWLRS
jgi:hypothetical protein